ncbi:hypothetical protein SCHPADRAFT_907885 [Schizopora paradoxa]|uniref:Uncharacterized protein n=1 Tax=Schizopora paradoxa TaxID=27342 RepID=A0A0H2RBQ9_9AGAM|nr:hypothetical protein SCHPADRAFT_907885 [Schizopora paradoxa]
MALKTEAQEKKNQALEKVCRSMYSEVRMLKDAAAGRGSAKIMIAEQKKLDGGRFLLLQGLIVVFPQYFTEALRERWDVDKIRWHHFNNAFLAFYNSHFTGGEQSRSVFSTVCANYNTIIPGRNKTSVPPTELESLGDFDLLESDVVKDPPKNWSSSKYWTARLKFVAPATIWVYCELRTALLNAYDDTSEQMKNANIYQELMNGVAGIGVKMEIPFPGVIDRIDVPSSCRVGTAYDFRSNYAWRDHIRVEEDMDEDLLKLPFMRPKPPGVSSSLSSHPSAISEASAVGTLLSTGLATSSSDHYQESSTGWEGTEQESNRRQNLAERAQSSMSRFSELGEGVVQKSDMRMSYSDRAKLTSFQNSLEDCLDEIDMIQYRMTFIRKNLMAVLKCLTIVLDPDLLNVAITGKSYTRMLAKYKNDKCVEYERGLAKKTSDGEVDVLHQGASAPPTSKRSDSETLNEKKEHVNLEIALFASDDFILRTRSAVEESIDRYVEKEVRSHFTSDLRLLVDYFEALCPPASKGEDAIPNEDVDVRM